MPLFSKDKGQRTGDPMKGRWTYSMISAYLKCPRYFELNYLEKKKAIYSSSLVEGISHHDALDEDNHEKYKRKALTYKQHFECFADGFTKDKKHIEIWDAGTDDKQIIHRGRGIIKSYKDHELSKFIPATLDNKPMAEWFFTFPVSVDGEEITMQGFVDIAVEAEFGLPIFDYKVTRNARAKGMVQNSLQLTIYKMAALYNTRHSMSTITPGIASLVKSTKKIDIKKADIGLRDMNHADRIIKGVVKAIRTGIYPPCNPENVLCSPKYCGQWHNCRGIKK